MSLTTLAPLAKYEEQLTDRHTAELRCDDFLPSGTDLYRIWASLLTYLTGNETTAFRVDDAIVYNVDANLNISPVAASNTPAVSRNATGIFFQKPAKLPPLALELVFEFNPTSTYLKSCGFCNHLFLGHILTFLDRSRQWIRSENDGALPVSRLTKHPLSILNPNPEFLLGPLLLHHLVKVREDRCAVDFLDCHGSRHQLSYKDLDNASDNLAETIRQTLGDKSRCNQPIIAILLPQSIELYVAELAVLKCGAAFCCIPTDLPFERLNFILQDISCALILNSKQSSKTDEGLTGLNGFQQLPINHLDMTPMEKHPNAVFKCSTSDNAYIMYTSGSTVKPKGVCISHSAIIQSLLAHEEHIPKFERFLQFSSPAFDVSVFEIFFVFFRGSTLAACERTRMLNDLVGVMKELQVDAAELTPTITSSLLQKRQNVPRLKTLLTIGELLTAPAIHEFGGNTDKISLLWAMYGPTEAAIHCTIEPAMASSSSVHNIGQPLKTVCAFVVASNRKSPAIEVLPIGFVGELAIGGHQLATCYLNRPEQTSSVFVNTQECGKIYLTGDKARMLLDGSIECLGRVTHNQLKIRGQRVELGEIEQTALRVTGCRVAACSVIRNTLVLFCCLEEASVLECIKAECEKWLPIHMVPQDIVPLDSIPHLTSGKIDRKSLEFKYENFIELSNRTPVASEAKENEVSAVHQWTSLQSTIRQVIAKIANIAEAEILVNASVFRYGIDSVAAIHLARILSAKLKLNSTNRLLAADILRNPKISELAQILSTDDCIGRERQMWEFDLTEFQSKWLDKLVKDYDLKLEEVESIRPCTPIQGGMLSRFLVSKQSYFNCLTYRCALSGSPESIKQVLLKTLQRNAIFRTGFAPLEDYCNGYGMVTYYNFDTNNLVIASETERRERWHAETASSFHARTLSPPWRISLVIQEDCFFLTMSMFHGLYDATSLRLFLTELSSSIKGESLPPVTSFDSAIQKILTQSKDGLSEAFWKDHLLNDNANDQNTHRFPDLSVLRQNHSNEKTHCFKTCSLDLKTLGNHCNRAEITLLAAGQATWTRMLSAYLSEETVSFGLLLSGRDAFDTGDSVMFPTFVTVPCVFKNGYNTQTLLEQVMSFNANAREHQFASLRDIAKWAGKSNKVLFDTIFSLQRFDNLEFTSTWTIENEMAFDEYSIALELEPISASELRINITFDVAKLPNEQAALMLDQFDFILCHIISSPDAEWPPSTFPRSLTSVVPPKTPELPSQVTLLHQFVEQNAKEMPNSPALEFVTDCEKHQTTSTVSTYQELNRYGDFIARLLGREGIAPQSLVAICFEKCPEASFAILGILKAGCAYVALDPQAPEARKLFIIQDSGCRIVLSANTRGQEARIPDGPHKVVNINVAELDEMNSSDEEAGRLSSPRMLPSDLCYCLYTSGTSGLPKGCQISHENVVQAMRAFSIQFNGRWNKKSRWLQFASFHFDVSVLEQFWSWSEGITVVSAPRDLMLQDLPAFINAAQITHLDLTPSLARLLRPEEVPSLCNGVFITGGETLRQDIVDQWGSQNVIYNGYGPTEATIGVTMNPRVPLNGKPSNIGKQFDNVGTAVLQPGTDMPVLRGAVGELCVYGKLVGQGYLNNPALTAVKFPDISVLGERVYRTGDLVRLMHNESFEFLGRNDDQIKLGGQRVEIREINSVIKEAELVREVETVVLLHPKQQNKQLVSFVVLHNDNLTAPDQVRVACQSRLPPYMVPKYFIPIDRMPLNANYKVNRSILQDLYSSLVMKTLESPSARSINGMALTRNEKPVAAIVARYFGLQESSLTKISHLLALGMDSISVISFLKLLQRSGFPHATMSTVMQNPTIQQLAAALRCTKETQSNKQAVLVATQNIFVASLKHRASVARIMRASSVKVGSLAPCTPLQEGMIAETLNEVCEKYFVTFKFLLKPSVDIEWLKRAWNVAFKNLNILRTCFVSTNDGAFQAARRISSGIPWKAVICETSEQVNAIIKEHRQSWIQCNKTVITKPVHILQIQDHSAASKLLILNLFHGIYDGWSLPILLDYVRDIYITRSVSAMRLQFEQVLPHGPLLANNPNSRNFWKPRIMGGWPRLPRSNENQQDTKSIVCEAKISDVKGVERVRRLLGVTYQAIFQASWSVALRGVYPRGPVTIGIIVSGRNIDLDGIDHVIGPLFNTILYQQRYQSSQSWGTMVKEAHAFNTASIPFQHTPLRDVLKWIQAEKHQSKLQCLFTFQVSNPIDNELWELMETHQESIYPIACEVELLSNSHFNVKIVGDACFCAKPSLENMMNRLVEYVNTIIQDPDAPFGQPEASLQAHMTPSRAINAAGPSLALISPQWQWNDRSLMIRKEVAKLSNVNQTQIGENQSIFELGLDSIDVVKLVSRLKSSGLIIRPSMVMQLQTIARMMGAVEAEESLDYTEEAITYSSIEAKKLSKLVLAPEVHVGNVQIILPPTPLQEAMFSSMIESKFQRYYSHDILKLTPEVNLVRLMESWRMVVTAHPILRTVFVPIHGSDDFAFAQLVLSRIDPIEIHDGIEEPVDFVQVTRTITERMASKAADSYHVVISFLNTTALQPYCIISLPHALYDGWSIQLLHHHVSRCYHRLTLNAMPYHDTLDSILAGSGMRAREYWQSYLVECPSTLISSPNLDDGSRSSRSEIISRVSLSAIRDFCKHESITIHQLTLTCYALALAFYTKSLHVSFALVLSGRESIECQQVVFPAMNTVIFQSILHGSFRDMLQQTQHDLSNILAHQHYPLHKALALVDGQGHGAVNFADTLFMFQARPELQASDDKGELYHSISTVSDVEFNLCVEAEILNERLIWNSALKKIAGTNEFLLNLDKVLEEVICNPVAETFSYENGRVSIGPLTPAFELTGSSSSLQSNLSSIPIDSETAVPSAIQIAIHHALSSVCNVPISSIGENTSIFELGLDSISAIKVSRALSSKAIKITVSSIMQNPTVKAMVNAAIIVNGLEEGEPDRPNGPSLLPESVNAQVRERLERMKIDQENVDYIKPASAGQTYFLCSWMENNGTILYPTIRHSSCYSTHVISEGLLVSIWSSLIQLHPILRTVFVGTNDPEVPFIQVCCKEILPAVLFGDDHARTSQPFCRLQAQKLDNGTWRLDLNIHHALYDAFSLEIIKQDFDRLLTMGRTLSPSVSTSRVESPWVNIKQAKSFWTSYLGASSNAPRSVNSTREDTKGYRFGLFISSYIKIEQIEAKAKSLNVSLLALILATYGKIFSSTFKLQEPVILGIYLANRSCNTLDLSNSAFPTLNVVPVRFSTAHDSVEFIAKHLQPDLLRIAGQHESSVSLGQVYQWTGRNVMGNFNFIKLPFSDEDVAEGTPVPTEKIEAIRDQNTFLVPNELRNEYDMAAYKPTLEIELLNENGYLSVGLIGPTSTMNLEESRQFLDDFKTQLESLAEFPV